MLVPKKNRLAVYTELFKEGVLVAKKDVNDKHVQLDVPNLHVVKLLQSLKSRGLVKEQFSWQWHYFFLTNEGIEYLRDYLHLTNEVVPATLKKTAVKGAARPSYQRREEGGGYRERQDDREGYRRAGRGAGEAGEKKSAPSGEFKPEFRGFGRGRGAPKPE